MSAQPTFPAPTQPTTGPARLPQRGEIFDGKYRIDDVLGVDGNGAVLAATRLDRGERVAIKVLLPEAVYDAELIARCAREGRASSKIRSEHIARASEAGLFQGRPYLVLEYAPGNQGAQALVDEGGIHRRRAGGPVRQVAPAPAQLRGQMQTLRMVPSARAALAQPVGPVGSAMSVPPPPLRSAVPGYLLAAGALLAIVAVAGGAVWHQTRALHQAEARVDPAMLAPAFHIPPVPRLSATAPTDQVTTTSAVVARSEPAAAAAATSVALAPAPAAAPPVDAPAATAPKHHHHHHVQAPREDSARAATAAQDDDSNPYATTAATPAPPSDNSHLFEIRK